VVFQVYEGLKVVGTGDVVRKGSDTAIAKVGVELCSVIKREARSRSRASCYGRLLSSSGSPIGRNDRHRFIMLRH
jgi:hypothetical protein